MNDVTKFTLIGFSSLMIAVGLGAFGAHGLQSSLSAKSLAVYHTGIEYLFYHGIGALALAAMSSVHNLSFTRSRFALMLGMLVFSGGCMLYAVTGQKFVAMIIPIGGLGYLFCWGLALKELASKFKKI